MSIFAVIGFAWIVFTSTIATVAFFYFAWCGLRRAARQSLRGDVEENLDLHRMAESRFLERLAK